MREREREKESERGRGSVSFFNTPLVGGKDAAKDERDFALCEGKIFRENEK